ncbi:hypothetical protein Hanom_Chr05g00416331 [Helianthus anomalus]
MATRSPSTSPFLNLGRQLPPTDEFIDRRGSDVDSSSEDEKDNSSRKKLKELSVTSSCWSSSPPFEEIGGHGGDDG